MKRKCQALASATHQLPGESRGGDDDTMANAMMIGWVGGSCPAHSVSLHALTNKHRKTATMATSQGNEKEAFSNWKYQHCFSLIEIKGKNVYVTCTLCPGKNTLSTAASSNSNLMKHLTSTHANTTLTAAANPTSSPNAACELQRRRQSHSAIY